MKIKEYLDKYKYDLQYVADSVGVTKQYIWMISSGKANPSVSLAHQIEAWSNGNVKVHEIRRCTKTCAPGCACSKGK